MCGIVGAIGERDVTPILLAGLKRLEYRGYDSAGVAVYQTGQSHLQRLRIAGKIDDLRQALETAVISGSLGIAHTRWATHGKPSEENAHPHMSGPQIALVHNGIIENFHELREILKTQHYVFESDTDSEIIVHLIHQQLQMGLSLREAVQNSIKKLRGAFALGVISSDDPLHLIAVRHGSPLVIGIGIDENFIASDQLALLPVTQQFIHLQEGDVAEISRKEIKIFDKQGKPVERDRINSTLNLMEAERGNYRHFMLKEIFEQPQAIVNTLQERLSAEHVLPHIFGYDSEKILPLVRNIQIVACGTSYHAGLVAKHWIESLAEIPCQVDIASEFRYRKVLVSKNTLFITLSQSGETADTIAALRDLPSDQYLATLAICNVPESSLVRESDLTFMTRAGIEIGVASTKAFTTQLTSLLLLTATLMQYQKNKTASSQDIVQALCHLSTDLEKLLGLNEEVEKLAQLFNEKHHTLFLGRGKLYPIALEGALKLKEISYIHAEAYPAGELKHGPLALVDKDMPVVAIAPNDYLLEKLVSNLYEVKARGGQLVLFTDLELKLAADPQVTVIKMPIAINPITAPILFTLPLQLLAYHVAVLKGTDVDQPRNLAKSVTVE
jgi:glutamine---fructose-6-phosphate transaminase (isomerizing)